MVPRSEERGSLLVGGRERIRGLAPPFPFPHSTSIFARLEANDNGIFAMRAAYRASVRTSNTPSTKFFSYRSPPFFLFRRLGWRRELNVTFAREKKGEGTYGDTQFRAKKALEKKGEGGKKSFFPQKHTVAKRKLRSRKLRQINNMY